MQIKGPLHEEKEGNSTDDKGDELSWNQFTQNTTFHGIRYIFDNNHGHRPRRILWTLCVCTAVILFFYQGISRANVYFQYHTNVGIHLKYVEQNDFPAVTICNSNNYRTTTLARQGMYYFVDAAYKLKGDPQADEPFLKIMRDTLEKANLNDTCKFYFDNAHERSDFIESCSWKGKPCDVERDFTTVTTEGGVCYTFNHRATELSKNSQEEPQPTIKTSEESGATYGLKLILNVEQYDHTKCPRGQAGARVILHDQKEVPQIADLAVYVAPGTATLIGVKRKEIQSIEAPYGTCTMDAEPFSKCIERKRLKASMIDCKCLNDTDSDDLVSYSLVGTPQCPLERWFVCSYSTMPPIGLAANCSIPCRRIQYDPILSHSLLSKQNTEILLFGTGEMTPRKRVIQQRFLDAREQNSRLVKETYARDHQQCSDAITKIATVITNLNESAPFMLSSAALAEHLSIGDVIGDLSLIVDSMDVKDVGESYGPHDLFRDNDYRMAYRDDIVKLTTYFTGMKYFYDKARAMMSASLMSDVDACDLLSVDTTMVEGYLNETYSYINGQYLIPFDATLSHFAASNSQPNSSGSIVPSADTGTCLRSICELMKSCYNIVGDAPFFSDILEHYDNYVIAIDELYSDTWVDPWTDSDKCHQDCLDRLHQFNTSEEKSLPGARREIIKFSNLTSAGMTFNQLNDDVSNLVTAINALPPFFEVTTITSQCGWPVVFMQSDISTYTSYNVAMRNVWKQLSPLAELYILLTNSFKSLHATVNKLSKYKNVLESYITGGNITKLEVAEFMNDMSLAPLLGKAIDQSDDLDEYCDELERVLDQAKDALTDAIGLLFTTKLPLFNDSVLMDSTLWLKIVEQTTDPKITEMMSNYTEKRDCTLTNIVIAVFDKIPNFLKPLAENFKDVINDMAESVIRLKADLAVYQRSCEMNNEFYQENFLRMNIFYKEMSYELIEMTPSFEGMSFMSEIGGFLGLLLGASCLTVCELLDMFILKMILKGADKKAVHPGEKTNTPPENVPQHVAYFTSHY